MTAFIVSGVAGVGKSTVASGVAARLQLPFVEADDFHSPANVAKMSAGIPLTDEDRIDWIDALVHAVNASAYPNVIIACSALTQKVRKQLRDGIVQPTQIIYLTAPPQVLKQRLLRRRGHFMKADMLESQLQTLEVPFDALVVDTDRPESDVIFAVAELIKARLGHPMVFQPRA